MSSVVLSGDSSGTVTLTVPSVAGTNTVTIPASTGIAVIGSSAVSAIGQIPFSTDGTSYTPIAKIVSGTAQASTSGTSIDFTGIPSWVKRITVMFNGVSTNGSSPVQVQLGTSGGIQATSYTAASILSLPANTVTSATVTTGFGEATGGAAIVRQGIATICLLDSSTGIWAYTANIGTTDSQRMFCIYGTKSLSGTLDRVRITTVNGTDTFDAGSINILYE